MIRTGQAGCRPGQGSWTSRGGNIQGVGGTRSDCGSLIGQSGGTSQGQLINSGETIMFCSQPLVAQQFRSERSALANDLGQVRARPAKICSQPSGVRA